MATYARIGARKVLIDDVEIHSVRSVDYKVRYNDIDMVVIEIIAGKIVYEDDGTIRITTPDHA